MSKTYPTKFCNQLSELPNKIDQTRLRQQGYRVLAGLDIDLAQQLIESSLEDHIVTNCPKDAAERFTSIESIDTWLGKGRLVLPLVKDTGYGNLKLAGLGWIGPAKPAANEVTLPGAELTFGLRLYDEALGKKLSFPYALAVLATNKTLYSNKGVWLTTRSDNIPAIKTYERAGFVKAAEVPAEYDGISHSRLYMMLGKWALA